MLIVFVFVVVANMRLKHFVMLYFVSISFNHFLYLILWPNTAVDIFRRFGHFFTFFFSSLFFYFDFHNLVAVLLLWWWMIYCRCCFHFTCCSSSCCYLFGWYLMPTNRNSSCALCLDSVLRICIRSWSCIETDCARTNSILPRCMEYVWLYSDRTRCHWNAFGRYSRYFCAASFSSGKWLRIYAFKSTRFIPT